MSETVTTGHQPMEAVHAEGRSQDVSSALLNETHVTGVQASFLSYLKECHVR